MFNLKLTLEDGPGGGVHLVSGVHPRTRSRLLMSSWKGQWCGAVSALQE